MGSVLIDHEGIAQWSINTEPTSVSPNKPQARLWLTGLYYDLHDKQLTNQKAVDSSGSYEEWEKLYSMEMGPCTHKCGVLYSSNVY